MSELNRIRTWSGSLSKRRSARLPLVIHRAPLDAVPAQDKSILLHDIPDMVDQRVYGYRGVKFHAGSAYMNYFPSPAEGDFDPLLTPGTEGMSPTQTKTIR